MLNLKDPAKCRVGGWPADGTVPGMWQLQHEASDAKLYWRRPATTMPQLVGGRATKAGATLLQGPAYYMCWTATTKALPDCTGQRGLLRRPCAECGSAVECADATREVTGRPE